MNGRSVLLVLGILALSVLSARGATGNRALTSLLERVEARRGVVIRSAVLIPLVLVEGIEGAEGLPGPGDDLSFVAEKGEIVRVPWEGEETAFLPAGTFLSGRGRERILSRSVLLLPGEELAVRAPFSDSLPGDPPENPESTAVFGPIAPPAQRRIDLQLEDAKSLRDLQKIQGILARLPAEAATVREVMGAPAIKEGVKVLSSRFGEVPSSFGGGVAGHVLFIGFRPAEIILFKSPADYRRAAGDYLLAAAVSVALWEEYYGVDPALVKEVDDRLFLPVVTTMLRRLSEAKVKRVRPGSKEKGGGDLHSLAVAGTDSATGFAGRLLTTPDDNPFHLEVFEAGDRVVLPPPLTKPGGRSVDARPDVSHGAMTLEFMRRLSARMAARRGR